MQHLHDGPLREDDVSAVFRHMSSPGKVLRVATN
jgi:hypothetical protein